MDTSGTNIDATSGSVQNTAQKILLIDLEDARRQSRVHMLESVGYEVETRANYVAAERLDHESRFDLIIVTLHSHPGETAAYSDHLSRTDREHERRKHDTLDTEGLRNASRQCPYQRV